MTTINTIMKKMPEFLYRIQYVINSVDNLQGIAKISNDWKLSNMHFKCRDGGLCEFYEICETHDIYGCIEIKNIGNGIKQTLLRNLLNKEKSNEVDILYNSIFLFIELPEQKLPFSTLSFPSEMSNLTSLVELIPSWLTSRIAFLNSSIFVSM